MNLLKVLNCIDWVITPIIDICDDEILVRLVICAFMNGQASHREFEQLV